MNPQDPLARLLVIGACSLTRKGIVAELATPRIYDVCGEVGDLPYARRLCEELSPDFIALDLDLPEGGELSLIRDLRKLHSGAMILGISHRDDPETIRRVFKAGARGYVAKRDCSSELRNGMGHLFFGEKIFMSPRIKAQVLHDVGCGTTSAAPSGIENLSDRALEVFRLVGEGKGPTEISLALKINVKTVETYHRRIKEKLDLRTMEELRRCAAEWRLGQTKKGRERKQKARVKGRKGRGKI